MIITLLLILVVNSYCEAKTIKIIKAVDNIPITNVDLERAQKLFKMIQPSENKTEEEVLDMMIESRRLIACFNELISKLAQQNTEVLKMISMRITQIVQSSISDPEILERLQSEGIGLLEMATMLRAGLCSSLISSIYHSLSGDIRPQTPLSPSSEYRKQIGRDVIYVREIQYHYNPDSESSKSEAVKNAEDLCRSFKNRESFPESINKIITKDEIEGDIFEKALESEKFSLIGPIERGNTIVVMQVIGSRRANKITIAKVIEVIKIPINSSNSEAVIGIKDLIESLQYETLGELAQSLKDQEIPVIHIKSLKISANFDDQDLYECAAGLSEINQISDIELKPSGMYICKLIRNTRDIVKPNAQNQELDQISRLHRHLAKRFPAIDFGTSNSSVDNNAKLSNIE